MEDFAENKKPYTSEVAHARLVSEISTRIVSQVPISRLIFDLSFCVQFGKFFHEDPRKLPQ